MVKRLLLAVLTITASASYAQTNDSATTAKRYTHQVGVQVNELFKQIFNFNGTAVNTNPYLFIYSINSTRSGWGLRTGVGYNYQAITTDDGITKKTSELNDLRLRVGGEKMFVLSRKWTTGIGADAVLNYNDDYTKTMVRTTDSVTTESNSRIAAWGGGPMGWIRYHISDHVLIGTEGSFYLTTGTEKSDVAITRRQYIPGPGGGYYGLVTTRSSGDNKRTEGTLSVPIAIFIVVKF